MRIKKNAARCLYHMSVSSSIAYLPFYNIPQISSTKIYNLNKCSLYNSNGRDVNRYGLLRLGLLAFNFVFVFEFEMRFAWNFYDCLSHSTEFRPVTKGKGGKAPFRKNNTYKNYKIKEHHEKITYHLPTKLWKATDNSHPKHF